MGRVLLGMSQEKLGKGVNLTFQQIQKYERGANRIGSSTLWKIGKMLDVPESFFFEDMPADISQHSLSKEAAGPCLADFKLDQRESLELLRNYYRTDPAVRKAIYSLVKAGAKAADDGAVTHNGGRAT